MDLRKRYPSGIREIPAALTWRRVLRELAKYGTLSYGTVPLSLELQRII